jgi:hypothetical protein
MRSIGLLFLLLSFSTIRGSSNDSTKTIELTGYMEAYYAYDFGQPEKHLRSNFFYSYNVHDELNLNIGYVKASLNKTKFRSNLALMGGTYSTYNLANEKGFLKNILEANIGFSISKKHKLWLDAGVLPSHIGFESAIGKDCWNLTRSILADNSPYFESGLKLGYTSKNDSLNFNFLVLNGWQKIGFNYSIPSLAIGTQNNYKKNDRTTINWSTFIGHTGTDSLKRLRCFNNFYTQYQLNKKLGFIFGLDYGIQQKKDSLNKMIGFQTWYSPIIIVQLKVHKKLKMAARFEYYSDKTSVIITTPSNKAFQTLGTSINLDCQISESTLWRLEARTLYSKEAVFLNRLKPTNYNNFITTSLSVSF